jgi:BMFP domain-containing protein YqiC
MTNQTTEYMKQKGKDREQIKNKIMEIIDNAIDDIKADLEKKRQNRPETRENIYYYPV